MKERTPTIFCIISRLFMIRKGILMNNIQLNKDKHFMEQLKDAIKTGHRLADWNLFSLHYEAKKTTMIHSFSELKTLTYLPHVQFLDHQIEAAKTVMEEMNGRAILADEVGLGKTIEAGLILKEYMTRGLVKKVLLLVPATLVHQWIKELQEKFYIQAASYRKNYQWDDYPIFVTSIDLAKRSPHREAILAIDYDMVIVDEAHKLKNHRTLNYTFVRSIQKKYCLLLTATPIQNKLIELFHLVTILKPGYLGDYESFTKTYGKKGTEKLQDTYLNKLVQKVMVRNRRKDTVLDTVERHVHSVWLQFSEEEKKVYEQLNDSFYGASGLAKITFLKELCSSREACYLSLEKSKNEQIKAHHVTLLDHIAKLPHHTKAKKLVELILSFKGEKVIVFTEYRATQYYLEWYLQQHDISVVSFRGGLKRGRKEWITQLFKQHKQVLLATEAGGEGINLQFCHHIINYDLPWNPMRLEQRIGRAHRYGQEHDIQIYNFAIENTLEEHMMNLLYEKIDIFERIIGKLDHILASLHIDNVEDEFKQMIGESQSVGEMKIKFDNFISVVHEMDDTYNEEHHGSY